LSQAVLVLALYVIYCMWVWWRYTNAWMPKVRWERLQGGHVLEVLIPAGSKADARAAADMFGQLWNLLSNMAEGGSGPAKMEAERLALSLEMWSTPDTGGKVGFYVWCPRVESEQHGQNRRNRKARKTVKKSKDRFIEEVRHLIMVHHPRCRVRWVEDPLKKTLSELGRVEGTAGETAPAETGNTTMTWYELGLRADSLYPISSGASDERLLTGSRTVSHPGSPGAGSDPLAAVIGMLGADKEVPVMGIQVVAAAQPDSAGRTQQTVSKELARLRELEVQAGKKALGPQHEARVLALEEKADRQGYDVAIRLVAVERAAGATHGDRAESRLASLVRIFRQYDRSIAGVRQGFQVVRTEQVDLSALQRPVATQSATFGSMLRRLAPVVGRWVREGVCLPRMLPFMRVGKPAVLNMAEISSIYHFPHQGLESLASLRRRPYLQIPAPASAHVTAEQVAQGKHVVLGVLDEDLSPEDTTSKSLAGAGPEPLLSIEQARLMGLTVPGTNVLPPGTRGVGTHFDDLRRGTYVLGPMGSGKSVFLYNMIEQYMSAGRGVGILDGKGDSYEEVLKLVPPHLEGEVLAFDPEDRSKGGGSGGRSIGINPLDGRVAAQLGAEKVESLTMSLMRKMMGANWDQSVLMQRFLRDGIIAVLEALPAPTMLNLWRWLQDDGKGGNEYREALVGKIRNRLVQDFWQRQVPAMSSQQRSSMQNVLTRVDRYVKNDVRYLLLQPYSTVNFQEIMDRGTIFVGRVSPRLGEDQSFLGALVLNGFLTGAFARQPIPQEQRRDYLLVMDEFQNFVDTARVDVERMLSMARSYRLGLMLAHQYTDQLPREVLNAILKNVQTWTVFGLQADDARRFAGYMEGLEAEDFQNLPPYYTYQRTIVGNEQTGVYSAAPLPPPLWAANPGERILSNRENELKERILRENQEKVREVLRSAHAPEHIFELVRSKPEEGKEARRARILKLAREIYWLAEEGNPEAIQVLSVMGTSDLQLYRDARRQILDKEEREQLLAQPRLIRDKVQRIERLSALRWGTPCAEVEALVVATLRGGADRSDGDAAGSTGTGGAQQAERYSLMPELDEVDEQHEEDAQPEGGAAPN
jgi:hypothetical protein